MMKNMTNLRLKLECLTAISYPKKSPRSTRGVDKEMVRCLIEEFGLIVVNKQVLADLTQTGQEGRRNLEFLWLPIQGQDHVQQRNQCTQIRVDGPKIRSQNRMLRMRN